MYAFIKGRLAAVKPASCVIDVSGVGYLIHIAPNTLGKLPQLGQELLLYSSFIVRDTGHSLYGFLSEQERELFDLLVTISGIGPKLALSIIGHLSLGDLKEAIMENRLNVLCKIPGIGKKTAERLIIEIRDKLDGLFVTVSSLHPKISAASQTVQDAMSALIQLGYHQNIAQKAVKKSLETLPENPEIALLITQALKNV